MAEENSAPASNSGGGGGGGEAPPPPKCPECVPGLPGWMATFSDMVTLLLTFFVLLLSFAKTETAKYESALGSVRNAFGGNSLKEGETVMLGKSADNQFTMLESQDIVRPFPIDFLTAEGLLDKQEVNRESDENLKFMKKDLQDVGLSDNVVVQEEPEGVKVDVKDQITFDKGSVKIKDISIEVFDRLVKILKDTDWVVFVEGHTDIGEISSDGSDSYSLSALRASVVTKALIQKGVRPNQITTVFYGDTRPLKIEGSDKLNNENNQRVSFMLRKRDLKTPGHAVTPY